MYFSMFDVAIFKKPKYPVAVVVPIYKSELTDFEVMSLENCLNVLGKHRIIVIAPQGLSLEAILNLNSHNITIEYFGKKYFENVIGYNKLMLSFNFYRKFIDYEYILIYQLDAFVFSDKLLNWCSLGFDYIGAPWIDAEWPTYPEMSKYLDKYKYKMRVDKVNMVGNGGFSLRKVRSALNASLLLGFNKLTWKLNEDIFWSFEVPKNLSFFKIPCEEVAMKFSFETNPRICFEKNNNEQPFGCHAWQKHDIEFWRPIFKKLGYTI